jgi:hypothetical protein
MDNPQQYVDEGTFRWTIGGIVSIGLAALGVLWTRITGVEKKHDTQGAMLGDKQHKGDDALWDAVNGNARDLQAFKEKTLDTFRDVPTKADLQAMENRIMAALRTRAPAE